MVFLYSSNSKGSLRLGWFTAIFRRLHLLGAKPLVSALLFWLPNMNSLNSQVKVYFGEPDYPGLGTPK